MQKGGRSVTDLLEIAMRYRQLAEDQRGGLTTRNPEQKAAEDSDDSRQVAATPMRGRVWIIIALVIASWAILVWAVAVFW